ncbi:hypothetical protein [Tessaracoccus coleopterorum]|uniref:hypothetical protein n=1 Tax=Tessaracoccus coleopterorum TaxID=2714950 RepID=UPI001E5FE459|nr:hypothetical protein [Tessaracoccus coleopterorum]
MLELLSHPEVTGPAAGGGARRASVAWADTGWIDRVRAEGGLVADEHAGIALVVAAIEAYEENVAMETERLLSTAQGGRPQTQHKSGAAVELKLRGVVHQVATYATGRAATASWSTARELRRRSPASTTCTVASAWATRPSASSRLPTARCTSSRWTA